MVDPEDVKVQFHILSLYGVNEKSRTFGVDMWFRQTWEDWRLAYDSFDQGGCLKEPRQGFALDMISQIWVPDIFIENQVDQAIIISGSWWIYPSGKVVYVRQMRLQLSCWEMTFDSLPFDIQFCNTRVGAFLEDSLSLSLSFYEAGPPGSKGFVTVATNTDTTGGTGSAGWQLTNARGSTPDQSKYGATQAEPLLFVEFELTRNSDYHLSFVIIPTALTMIICYMVLWMDGTRADRPALAVVCFLIQSGIMGSQLISLPQLGLRVWLLSFLLWSEILTMLSLFAVVLEDYWRKQRQYIFLAQQKAILNRQTSKEQNIQFSDIGMASSASLESLTSIPHKKLSQSPLTLQEVVEAGGFSYFYRLIHITKRANCRVKPIYIRVVARILYAVGLLCLWTISYTTVRSGSPGVGACISPASLSTVGYSDRCAR